MTLRDLTDEEARELVRQCDRDFEQCVDQYKKVGTDIAIKTPSEVFRKGFDKGMKAALEKFGQRR